MIHLLIVLVAATAAFADAPTTKERTSFNLKKFSDTLAMTSRLTSNQLTVFGKEWPAQKFCNEETIANPDQLEAFYLSGDEDKVITLCAGSLDGEENVVSVFSKTQPPKVKRLLPHKTTHRITDQVLKKTVEELLASKGAAQ